jgi:hypothetical protein
MDNTGNRATMEKRIATLRKQNKDLRRRLGAVTVALRTTGYSTEEGYCWCARGWRGNRVHDSYCDSARETLAKDGAR